MTSSLAAVNAYRNQLNLLQDAVNPQPQETGDAPSFSQLVQDAAKTATDSLSHAETLQIQSLTGGKVDLADLVTAVADAELTLNTVVAVRDRAISAYQSIINMPI